MRIYEIINMAPKPKQDPKTPKVVAGKKIKELKKLTKRNK